MIKPKNNIPQLDEKTASTLLQNVFKSCDAKPNTIPLEVLSSYSNYRKERFILQNTAILIAMLLFLLLPVLFISPDYEISATADPAVSRPAYHIRLNSLLPVKSVTAALNGQYQPVYLSEDHLYTITPSANGEMDITVTLINGQYLTKRVNVVDVDYDAPVLESYTIQEKKLQLKLRDKGSQINFAGIYAITPDQQRLFPASYEENSGMVQFLFEGDMLNIFIPDQSGNTLQLIISRK